MNAADRPNPNHWPRPIPAAHIAARSRQEWGWVWFSSNTNNLIRQTSLSSRIDYKCLPAAVANRASARDQSISLVPP
jgi:hypothetical protein